jgi:hypothetical protein
MERTGGVWQSQTEALFSHVTEVQLHIPVNCVKDTRTNHVTLPHC